MDLAGKLVVRTKVGGSNRPQPPGPFVGEGGGFVGGGGREGFFVGGACPRFARAFVRGETAGHVALRFVRAGESAGAGFGREPGRGTSGRARREGFLAGRGGGSERLWL